MPDENNGMRLWYAWSVGLLILLLFMWAIRCAYYRRRPTAVYIYVPQENAPVPPSAVPYSVYYGAPVNQQSRGYPATGTVVGY